MKIANFIFSIILIFWIGLNYSYCQTSIHTDYKAYHTKTNSKTTYKANRQIQKLYKKGYISASIDTIVYKNNTTVFHIYTGPQYQLQSININSPLNSQQKNPYFRSGKRNNYNLKKTEDYESKLIYSYQNSGYPQVSIDKKTSISADHKITHNWTVHSGDFYKFSQLKTDSLHVLEKKYLAGLTGIKAQKKYQQKLITELESRINNSGLYQYDSVSVSIHKKTIEVKPYLTKLLNNTVSGLVGIQTSNTSKTTITGQLEINTYNILKTGEHIHINWQRTAPESQLIDASTKFSYIFGTPIGLLGNLYIDKHDSTYVNQSSKLGLIFFLNPKIDLSSYYSAANYKSEDEQNQQQTSKQKTYGLLVNTKHTDNYFLPNKGFISSLDFQTGTRESTTKQNITRLKFDATGFVPLPIGNILISEKLGTIINDSLTKTEYFQIGGFKTIRGFNEKSIFAKSYSISSLEYRIKIANNSYTYVFYDFGISPSTTSTTKIDKRNSIGAGILLKTKAGIINLTYAIGQLNNEPLNYNNGVIHIGYSTLF